MCPDLSVTGVALTVHAKRRIIGCPTIKRENATSGPALRRSVPIGVS
jgi:hypothetical protein